MKLTPKQKAFADYYIELGNATEAYLKAGLNIGMMTGGGAGGGGSATVSAGGSPSGGGYQQTNNAGMGLQAGLVRIVAHIMIGT